MTILNFLNDVNRFNYLRIEMKEYSILFGRLEGT